MRFTTIMCTLLIGLAVTAFAEPPALERAVAVYWESLVQGDLNTALESVTRDSRNQFIRQSKVVPRSWEIKEIKSLEPEKVLVRVLLESATQGAGGSEQFTVDNYWILEQGQWKLLIEEQQSSFRRLWEGREPSPPSGTVEVAPQSLKIHFISPTQTGSIAIRNGLQEDLRLTEIRYDQDLFEIADVTEAISPGQNGRIVIRYRGKEQSKNLPTQLDLRLRSLSGRHLSFSVPVTYNYMSRGTRALLGLTQAEAEELGRQEVFNLKPAVSGYPGPKSAVPAPRIKELLRKPQNEELR